MQAKRQSVTLTADQLALVILEARLTGLDRASVIRQCVSKGLAHLRGGDEYKRALEEARALRGDAS